MSISHIVWETGIVRYLTKLGIPGLSYNRLQRQIVGISGFILTRIVPSTNGGWIRVPTHFMEKEEALGANPDRPMIMFITQKHNGPALEDSFVIMRLRTFGPIIARLIEIDPERYIGKS